jgi:hypothetical protein
MLVLPLWASLLACNDAGFQAVTIRPTYGFVDGCTPVTVTGRGFDDQVTAELAGKPLDAITLPDPGDESLSGYTLYGFTPAGTAGFADLEVINGDGQTGTVEKAFSYVECPGTPWLTSISVPARNISAGDTVGIEGCGLAEGMQIRLVRVSDPSKVGGTAPITLSCGSSTGSFVAPDAVKGNYMVLVTDAAGTVLFGTDPCDTDDTGYYDYGYVCSNDLIVRYRSGT